MKKQSLWQAVKYALFSISAGGIQAVSFTLLFDVLLHSNPARFWVCHVAALVLSVLWNFTLNRKFTFGASNNIPIAMLKVTAFYLVFTPLSTWWSAVLTEPDYGIMINEYVVLIGTMVINFVTEYLFQRFVVFGKSLDTAVKEKE